MKINPKKCKGTGKAKGYGCGTLTVHRVYGLCKMKCYPDWLLNSIQGKEKLKKATLRATKGSRDLEAFKIKSKQKTITQLIQEARTYFQKWIRKRDENLPCISCGDFYTDLWDGGHYYKAEVFTGLIFNEINCNKQCRKCNRYLSGNESGYRKGLIQKYGISKVEELDKLSDRSRIRSYDREELKNIKKYYQNKLKE